MQVLRGTLFFLASARSSTDLASISRDICLAISLNDLRLLSMARRLNDPLPHMLFATENEVMMELSYAVSGNSGRSMTQPTSSTSMDATNAS